MIENYVKDYSNIVFMLTEEFSTNGSITLKPLGTAFLCHKDGLFLTCGHILDLTKKYHLVLPNNINEFNYITLKNIRSFEVIIKQYDSLNDVALLEVKNNNDLKSNFQMRVREEPILVGESICYLGYPFLNLDLHNLTASKSIISSKVKFDNGTNQYQIDSIVHEGSSGGPLIDLKTNSIIGIISGTFDPQERTGGIRIISNGRTHKEVTSISYATPIEYGIELLKNEGKI